MPTKNKQGILQNNNEMKIFKTKSILFAIATAMVVVMTLPILQSCSSEEEVELTPKTENKLKRISLSEIPKGVTPIVVKNESELMRIITYLESREFSYTDNPRIIKNGQYDFEATYRNTEPVNLNKKKRFKIPGEYASSTESELLYDIVVECRCSRVNDPNVSLTSRVTNFTIAYFTWNQTQASGTWYQGVGWWLSYSVTGTLDAYLVVYGQGNSFLWRREKTVTGCLIF